MLIACDEQGRMAHRHRLSEQQNRFHIALSLDFGMNVPGARAPKTMRFFASCHRNNCIRSSTAHLRITYSVYPAGIVHEGAHSSDFVVCIQPLAGRPTFPAAPGRQERQKDPETHFTAARTTPIDWVQPLDVPRGAARRADTRCKMTERSKKKSFQNGFDSPPNFLIPIGPIT